MIDLTRYPARTFTGATGYRIIPSKYPPIHLFEDVATPEEFAAAYRIQAVTNPRLQHTLGNIDLVPLDDMQLGVTGAGYIMAPFTHLNTNGSRFSSGEYGVFYAGETLETAVAETCYHLSNFLRASKEPAQLIQMRGLSAVFNAQLTDICGDIEAHDPVSYHYSQQLGNAVKQHKADGLYYRSVRHTTTHCYALFRPKTLTSAVPAALLAYAWNGTAIDVSRYTSL